MMRSDSRAKSVTAAIRQLGESITVARDRYGVPVALVIPVTHEGFPDVARSLGCVDVQDVDDVQSVRSWLDDQYLVIHGAATNSVTIHADAAHQHHVLWCEDNDVVPVVDQQRFHDAMRALGCPVNTYHVRGIIPKITALSDVFRDAIGG